MAKVNSAPLILRGREVADEVLKSVTSEINQLKAQGKRLPGLAVVLVGNNPASHTYVTNKEKACIKLGIHSEIHKLTASTSEPEVAKLIKSLNNNNKIDGILIQLPLPSHIKIENIIEHLDPNKDIDGLHPYNLGKLFSLQNCLTPCTPLGIMEMLKYYSINVSGMSATVIGRSTLVSKPVSMLLLRENATVTITHSKTENIEEITKSADILICAIGKPKLVKKHWIKSNAVVIDVGINKINENGIEKICGDVDFEDVSTDCQAITPVPGGIGPVTIAMLMKNTLQAYKIRTNI